MSFPILGLPIPAFFDSTGAPLASGTLSILDPADDTNKAYYPTADDADALTNAGSGDITLNARGETPNGLFGIDGEDYKVVLKDSLGTTLWTVDDVLTPRVANYTIITSEETSAGVTPTNYSYIEGDIRRYGATTAAADNSTAINAAISVNAAGGNEVFIPGGSWTSTSDINILSNTLIRGSGEESHLIMSGCKIHADGPTAGTFITGWAIRNIQCSRTGAAGPVIHLEGGESSDDPIRFCLDDIYISGSTGTGLYMQSTYIGDIVSPLIRGCVTGVVFENKTAVAANAISFFGGEIQNNTTGMTMNDCNGIQFFGTVIEGNSGGGLDIRRRCAATGLYNTWFEGNGSFDVRVGNDATSPRQSQVLNIQGGLMSDGSSGKDHGIILESCAGVNIENVYHTGYTVSLVANDQAGAGSVRGIVKNVYAADSIANLDTPNIYIYEQQEAGELAYSLRTGAGAIALTSPVCLITTTGTDALTLADGYEAQKLRLTMIADGGVGTLTPSNLIGGTTLTFDDVGDSADLQFLSGNWHIMGGTATLA